MKLLKTQSKKQKQFEATLYNIINDKEIFCVQSPLTLERKIVSSKFWIKEKGRLVVRFPVWEIFTANFKIELSLINFSGMDSFYVALIGIRLCAHKVVVYTLHIGYQRQRKRDSLSNIKKTTFFNCFLSNLFIFCIYLSTSFLGIPFSDVCRVLKYLNILNHSK